jgi:hypothetical protein
MSEDFISRNGNGTNIDTCENGNELRQIPFSSVPTTPDSTVDEMLEMGVHGHPKSVSRSRSPVALKAKPGTPQDGLSVVDFAELKDGTLAECIEDPNDSRKTLFAVWKDGKTTYRNRLERDGVPLIPMPRDRGILPYVQLARGAKPYESESRLNTDLGDLIRRYVSVKEDYVLPLVSFVLASWIVDRLPVAPYLSIVGLPESGKTTLLRVLSLVCRRALLTGDITPTALYEACTQLMPTLLIDEGAAAERPRTLHRLMRMGTTRDVVAIRQNRVFHSYCMKVICRPMTPDDHALDTRCLQIEMVEAENCNLAHLDTSEAREQADKLRAQLLQFRFEHFSRVRIPEAHYAKTLRPRSLDLFCSLAASFAGDPVSVKSLAQFFAKRDFGPCKHLSSPESAVLAALFTEIHKAPYTEDIGVKNLTVGANAILKDNGSHLRMEPRKVGAAITSLGIVCKRRTSDGWHLYLNESDQDKIHKLAETHGVEYEIERFLEIDLRDCLRCSPGSGIPQESWKNLAHHRKPPKRSRW